MNTKLGLMAALCFAIGTIPPYSEAKFVGVFLSLMLLVSVIIGTIESYYTLKGTRNYTQRQQLVYEMRRAAPIRYDIGIIFLCCLIAVSDFTLVAWMLAGAWIAKLTLLAYARKVGG